MICDFWCFPYVIFCDFVIIVCDFFVISRDVYKKKISDLPLGYKFSKMSCEVDK